jgi:L-fuconolactonase
MIIDSHTHFYDPARPGGVPWPPADSSLYRTVLPADFRAVASPCGVDATVVVEASPLLEDNDWILDIAGNDPSIVGFIGNLDLCDDRFAGHLERLARNPIFRGIRARGFAIDELSGGPELAGLERLAALGLVAEIMVKPATLLDACALARRLPGLTLIVDHIAHVAIDGASPDPIWLDGIARLSEYRNVYCKLSRLTESAVTRPAPSDPAFYRPTIEALWNTFGPERLLWGSNWPVTELASDYATSLSVATAFLADRRHAERERVLWKTAVEAYGLAIVTR